MSTAGADWAPGDEEKHGFNYGANLRRRTAQSRSLNNDWDAAAVLGYGDLFLHREPS